MEQLQLPEKFNKYTLDEQNSIIKYLENLDSKQKVAYFIAKEHLGTSFDITKSIGYIEWKKKCSN